MKIALIGSGNVATQLGKALKAHGHKIVYVYSLHLRHAQRLGIILNAASGNKLRDIVLHNAEVYIIAVKDDAIADVVSKMPPVDGKLVIHTSGATDISVLKNKFENCGVLWQIQTIKPGNKSERRKVPLVIEAGNKASLVKLKKLALELSAHVYVFSTKQRQVLHLVAVFINNFPNHLFYLGQKLLDRHHLPFEIYFPLMQSTIESAKRNPFESQTGPARRNDRKTMTAHLKLLIDKKYRSLYKLLSKSITDNYKH
jgi:predicted short-subunit dehydrogenase-like oxidoreductase (DUF2520 family)